MVKMRRFLSHLLVLLVVVCVVRRVARHKNFEDFYIYIRRLYRHIYI